MPAKMRGATHAHLRRLRLPLPAHRRRRRALVSQPRRAPGRRRARGHLPDAAPVGSRRAPRDRRGAGRGGRPADGALHRRATRRILPPLVFGLGVLWHLLRHGRRYDVVHTCAFPYFSLLAAAAAAAAEALWAGRRLVRGLEPRLLARLSRRRPGADRRARPARSARRVPQRAFCFSELHAARLRAEGLRGQITVLRGLYAGPLQPRARPHGRPAGPVRRATDPREARHARRGRGRARRAADRGPAGRVLRRRSRARGSCARRSPSTAPSRSSPLPASPTPSCVDADMRRALCMLLPSRREGYGMVVVEASAHATPSIVVAAEDNAATELVEDGVNGIVVASADPEAIARGDRARARGWDGAAREHGWLVRRERRGAVARVFFGEGAGELLALNASVDLPA